MTGVLQKPVAIVTGAGSGIGRAVAIALAAKGSKVLAADKSEAGLSGTLECVPPGQLEPLVVDVRDESALQAAVAQTLKCFGRIDTLVAAAGILRQSGTSPKPVASLTAEEWDAVVDTNLRGMFLSMRAVLPVMVAQRSGNIVAISSTAGKQGRAHDAPYCASKFGVIGLAESVAEEVRPHGIRVMTVIPDAVATPFWEQNGPVACPPDALAPERVAEFICYLLALPPDAVLLNPVIAPFRTRKRIRRAEAEGQDRS